MRWRDIGDVDLDTWSRVLRSYRSNLARDDATLKATWSAARPHSALCLAMMIVESRAGTEFTRTYHGYNALNLRPRDGGVDFLWFQSWQACVDEWRARITDPAYAYATTVTVEDLVAIYAPSSDGNRPQEYADAVARYVNAWPLVKDQRTMAKYPVAGLSAPVELPVPLVQWLIPTSQTKQRPSIKRQPPGYWVQHETGNPAPGADARMHAQYLHNGAGGATLSYHFAVDDKAIYQLLPVDEVSWQAADGNGPGNMSGVSCELCINAGIDVAKSRANAEALAAGVMRALGLKVDRVKRHWDFNAAQPPATRHHCPDRMMSQGYWPTFVANVGRLIDGGGAAPEYVAPVAPPPIDGRDQVVNGITFWAIDRTVAATTTAPALQYASPTASPTRPPFRAGETFRVAFAVEGEAFGGSRWWYVLPSGSRVPQATCTPRVTVVK